ncbi:trypsin-like peptidase domain-containing protein [Planococcus sp. APC 3900]|uniref:trypsin-like peptidase domain-containing protein n=1 Tax=Planococcus sp. APC 3900 TaxID=3035191 RepID=UPI0025B5940B|nr:trypsin-like peptidase domain-containing protein [Planococcus sp. APC 3900]MDN3437324.1 trypsin-like peptidase domain-containing protein [Planococcus sp. APC 3900]
MKCSNCREKNEEEAKFCRNCGTLLEVEKSGTSKKRNILILLLVLVLAVGFGLQNSLFGNGEERNTNEQTFEGNEKSTGKKEIIKNAQKKVYTVITDNGFGSGFLFEENGMVVTNAHVVAGYTNVTVRDIDGEEYSGQVVGISDVEDIALIKVISFEGIEPLTTEMEVTDVGTEVIALGSPNGFENSASIGYLTGINRDITFDFQYEDVYQIDAQIAPGSSGGPLINAENGKVIGINSLLYNEGNAIGFSIPLHSVYNSFMEWKKSPMSAAEVSALFGIYNDYETSPKEFEDEENDSEEYGEEYDSGSSIIEEEAVEFLSDYRSYYEMALSEEDFYYVEDMLLYDSPIYNGISSYIDQVTGRGMIFEFVDFTVLETEIFEKYAIIQTYESFDFMNTSGDWTFEERYKTYKVVMDDYDDYYIADIEGE